MKTHGASALGKELQATREYWESSPGKSTSPFDDHWEVLAQTSEVATPQSKHTSILYKLSNLNDFFKAMGDGISQMYFI